MFMMYFIVVETTYNGPRAGGKEIELEEKGSSFTIVTESKETYKQQLRLFRGRISEDSFWRGAWKPVPLIAYPAVLFSTVVYGSYFTWLLTISVLSVTAFSMPPYNLNPAQIGATNLPLLVVGLIGSPLSGWLADAIPKFMARRNGGVFEPEFRLVLMLIATPLATAGFLGFGMSVQNGAPLVWPVFFMSIHSLSVPFASQASLAYVIDCHPKDANQAFVTINFTKAVFTFLATTYANGWMASIGPRNVFTAITMINLAVCALTIPAYVYGKRFRSLVSFSTYTAAWCSTDSLFRFLEAALVRRWRGRCVCLGGVFFLHYTRTCHRTCQIHEYIHDQQEINDAIARFLVYCVLSEVALQIYQKRDCRDRDL